MGTSSGARRAVPPRRTKSERPDIVWFGEQRRSSRRGRPLEYVTETWITAPVGDGAWTIGYRIDAVGGVPRPAEVRLWQKSSPPWAGSRAPTPGAAMPSVADAQRVLSPQKALQAWFELNEEADTSGEAVRFAPQEHGYDPAVVQHFPQADDPYYAAVAARYVEIKRRSSSYAATLAREFGLRDAGEARKIIYRCRKRGLLAGDELTASALELRQRAA